MFKVNNKDSKSNVNWCSSSAITIDFNQVLDYWECKNQDIRIKEWWLFYVLIVDFEHSIAYWEEQPSKHLPAQRKI